MINTDRIVPSSAIDLLSLYATMLKLTSVTLTLEKAVNPGEFEVAEAPQSGSLFADEPVKALDFGAGVSAATVYFVPSYDYAGFKVAGTAVTTTGDTVKADGRTLYLATLSSGGVSIAAQGV